MEGKRDSFFKHVFQANMSMLVGSVATQFLLSRKFSVKSLGQDHEISGTIDKNSPGQKQIQNLKPLLS